MHAPAAWLDLGAELVDVGAARLGERDVVAKVRDLHLFKVGDLLDARVALERLLVVAQAAQHLAAAHLALLHLARLLAHAPDVGVARLGLSS